MNINFFTKESQFTVVENKLLKNGEIIAQGDVHLSQLVMGYPAFIIITENEFCPPVVIKTEMVVSILPSNEYLDGMPNPLKKQFRVDFVQDRKEICLVTNALNQEHAAVLIKLTWGDVKVNSITKIDYIMTFA